MKNTAGRARLHALVVLQFIKGPAHGPPGSLGWILVGGDLFGFLGDTACRAGGLVAGHRIRGDLACRIAGDMS